MREATLYSELMMLYNKVTSNEATGNSPNSGQRRINNEIEKTIKHNVDYEIKTRRANNISLNTVK